MPSFLATALRLSPSTSSDHGNASSAKRAISNSGRGRSPADTSSTAVTTSASSVATTVLGPEANVPSSHSVDIENNQPSRRRTVRRGILRSKPPTRSISSGSRSHRRSHTREPSFPSHLRRRKPIANEPLATLRRNSGLSDRRITRDPVANGRHPAKDQGVSRRRTFREKVAATATRKHGESQFAVNPSLLSVLTSASGVSSESNGSTTTITQKSYLQRSSQGASLPGPMPRNQRSSPRAAAAAASMLLPKARDHPRIAEDAIVDDDARSSAASPTSSTTSSHNGYFGGAASSGGAETPSSQSTFPSPTGTRRHSVAELRRKYDLQQNGTRQSNRSRSPSSDLYMRGAYKMPGIGNMLEDDEDDEEAASSRSGPSEREQASRRYDNLRSAQSEESYLEELRHYEESMRRHIEQHANDHYGHTSDPVYGQRRSTSFSSVHSDSRIPPYSMQQYSWPMSPPTGQMHPAMQRVASTLTSQSDRPPAPDAPDLTGRTLRGYEMVAVELASPTSPVTPLYRKFEYLHHRILLYLQDELSELEEQLRTLDEILAQRDSVTTPGATGTSELGDRSFRPAPPTASRRADSYHGTEIHRQRTQLLGRIFQKTEQYRQAMTAYTATNTSGRPATGGQVAAYRKWMRAHAPLHSSETRFLSHELDLIDPGARRRLGFLQDKSIFAAYLPPALMMPMMLFALVPDLAGRLFITALLAVAFFCIAAASPQIQNMLRGRDWAICGAVYVLLMSAMAGCIR